MNLSLLFLGSEVPGTGGSQTAAPRFFHGGLSLCPGLGQGLRAQAPPLVYARMRRYGTRRSGRIGWRTVAASPGAFLLPPSADGTGGPVQAVNRLVALAPCGGTRPASRTGLSRPSSLQAASPLWHRPGRSYTGSMGGGGGSGSGGWRMDEHGGRESEVQHRKGNVGQS